MKVSNKLLQVKDVRKVFGEGQSETHALKGVTFDVLRGEFLGIMGASGSGKTTLLNAIATMLKPTSGQILLDGQNISSFKGSQLAFQGEHDEPPKCLRGGCFILCSAPLGVAATSASGESL